MPDIRAHIVTKVAMVLAARLDVSRDECHYRRVFDRAKGSVIVFIFGAAEIARRRANLLMYLLTACE
jgi:hypothetical protein